MHNILLKKELHIKNMVCPRCIEAVRNCLIASELEFSSVILGKVTLNEPISITNRVKLEKCLKEKGFELIDSDKDALISEIKNLIITQIHHSKVPLSINYSTFLAKQTQHEYTHLSRLFSVETGMTIEKFISKQKVERVKELLIYDQLSTAQIAFQMGYSSVAHLSSQFKKETGMTMTVFKISGISNRKSLDEV